MILSHDYIYTHVNIPKHSEHSLAMQCFTLFSESSKMNIQFLLGNQVFIFPSLISELSYQMSRLDYNKASHNK